jgi:hypothetical protein
MARLSGCLMLKNFDFPFQTVPKVHPGGLGIVVGLDAGPELHRVTEIAGKAQRCVGADAALPPAYLVDAHDRDVDVMGKPVLADVKRFQEFFQKYFAGMYRRKISHVGHLNDNR